MTGRHSNPASRPVEPAPPGRVTTVSATRAWLAWLIAVGLVVVTMALYWPATHGDFINYDDPDYVTDNPRVLAGLNFNNAGWAFTTDQAMNWHPVTWLSLMLDVNLFGTGAAGFHFTNMALHAVNAALLFWLLLRLTGARWRSASVAALFAWHPVHVESVAWVSERKDVLSTGFGLLALLFYAQYARSAEASGRKTDDDGGGFCLSPAYWLAWFCFALGLLSKPMLVTWPFVLLLLDFWPLGRFQPGRAWPLVREKIPFLALAAAVSAVTFLVQKESGAMKSLAHLPLAMRGGNALISDVRYLGKLFWPENLAVIYPYHGYWPLAQVLLAGAGLAGMTGLAWWQRGRCPFLLFGWLWFLGTLAPVIGVVQVGIQAMADRYTYIPSVGILVAVVWGVAELTRCGRGQRLALAAAGAAVMFVCMVLTRQQLGYWRDSETLFRHALAVTENNYTAHNNLGTALLAQGRTESAVVEFQDAVSIQPEGAEAHHNLGIARLRQGGTEAANNEFQAAIRFDPEDAIAHYNLGNWLAQQGQTGAAIAQYEAALGSKPNDMETHYNLGLLLAKEGQSDAASVQFEDTLRLRPGFVPAHYNLGILLDRRGLTAAAIEEYQTARQLQPDDPKIHYNLGLLLAKEGQTDAALNQLEAAIHLQPDYASAHNSLGILLAAQGRLDEAINEFKTALRLKPDYASAQAQLAKTVALKSNSKGRPAGQR